MQNNLKKSCDYRTLIAGSMMALATSVSSTSSAADYVITTDQDTGTTLVNPGDSIISEDVPMGAPNSKPPPYTLLRYTERYTQLADPAQRNDFFDSYKYIPLSPDNPESYLSLGGEIRERYEHYQNQGFGIKYPGNDQYGLQRIMLHADLHANERIRFFIQGISSLQFGGKQKLDVNQNPLDLQQAFVDYTFGEPTPNGERETVRLGRFSMTYGSGRLIAARSGPNTQLKFDGAQFVYSKDGNKKLYAFATRPVKEDRYDFDEANQAQSFSGIYASWPLNQAANTTLDAYFLDYRNDEAAYVGAKGSEDRQTYGVRWSGKNGHWDYDWEAVAQLGEVGNKDIRAWTLATDTGYTFKETKWQSRVGLKADVASGDSNKNDGKLETFNPLFFKANYFNDAAFFRPANLADVHLTLQLQPRDDITVTIGTDSIWRHKEQDALYGVAGNVLLPATHPSKYVGTTAEAALQWKVDRHLIATASYVHMFTSSQVDDAGGKDIDYLATWISFIW
ncbi:MAG TPA: alginate export family protein [Methylotenera sp.]|nr:alginate export family protein [Methylotenera sp.]